MELNGSDYNGRTTSAVMKLCQSTYQSRSGSVVEIFYPLVYSAGDKCPVNLPSYSVLQIPFKLNRAK